MFMKYCKLNGALLVLIGLMVGTPIGSAKEPSADNDGLSPNDDADAYVVRSYPLDTKEYRYLALDNGLKVLLVSDADAAHSSAALSVDVGAYHDPEGWDGLAHYLEHMLFLGTEKYPDADEYTRYLSQHGGSRNAATEYDKTNYYFSVDTDGFEGTLDRFAQFFIAPLFDEKYVEREKNAVHAEYSTRINADGIRNVEVFENVINPRHPAAKFNAGNRNTLADKPNETARDVLIEFYERYYSADQMTLAMVSGKPLDELEQLARQKFKAVPRRAAAPAMDFPPLFTEGTLPKVIEIKPVQEQRTLSVTFPIDSLQDRYRENPLGYITTLLNTEVENSVQDRLKAKGWIHGMGAGPGMQYGDNGTFVFAVQLTERGLNHQDEIIAALFDQIALVREGGIEAWRYAEIKNVAEMNFRYAYDSRGGTGLALGLAKSLHTLLPRDLFGSGYQRYDAALIASVLAELRPDNAVVTLVEPGVEPDRTTEFYGARYRVYRPSAERLARWSEPLYTDLTLPKRNPLIAENLELEELESLDKPVKLSDSGLVELWHLPNIEDGIPRARVNLMINRPDRPTPEQGFILQLYFSMLTEQLQDLSHIAAPAGLAANVGPGGVTLAGYSDKLPEFADIVLSEVLNPRFTQQQFDRRMEGIEQGVRNYHKVAPTQGVVRALNELLNVDSHSLEEQLAVVRSITMEDVLAAPEWIYGESKVQMFAAGNMTEAQARAFADRIVGTLGITGTDRELPFGTRIARVAESEDAHDVFVTELEHHDTAVIRYYQGRDNSQKERMVLTFLGQMIHQEYFNELRTEQQLGYVVQASYNELDLTPGLSFIVQSPTADGNEIEAATDRFLPAFREVLADKTAADFDKLKQASLDRLKLPPANFVEKIDRFLVELMQGYFEFDSREQAIEAINAVTLDDVRAAYEAVVFDNPRVLSVIAPGALGGVKGTIDSPEAFHQDSEIIVRSRDDEEVIARN